MSTVVDDHAGDHDPSSLYDRRLYGKLLAFARPHAGALLGTIGLLAMGLVLGLLETEIIQRTLDGPVAEAARHRGEPEFDPAGPLADLGRAAGLYLLLAAGGAGLLVLREWLMNRTGQRIVYELRNKLFGHVLRLPVGWFDKHHVGWIVTRTTSDVDSLSELFTTGVSTIAYDLLTIAVVVVVLLVISPPLALVALLILPVMVWVSFRFRLNARLAFRATRSSLSRMNGFFQERLAGLAVVRLFRREQASARRFDELNTQYWRDNMLTVRHFSLFFPTVDTLSMGVKMGTLVWGSWLLVEGQLTVGVFVQFWLLLDRVFEPIRELAERYNVLQAAMAAGERIFGILDAPTEDQAPRVAAGSNGRGPADALAEAVLSEGADTHDEPDADALVRIDSTRTLVTEPEPVPAPDPARTTRRRVIPGPVPALEFHHVSFAYPGGPLVLDDVSFTVARGERVAVVGHTGAGKTTLVSLLCRFHETPHGSILVDGVDVNTIPHHQLRRRIAIVQQDVFLFSDTIAANIRMGQTDLPDGRVREMARATHAAGFIERLPLSYETRLLERGSNLSSGQRQLVAFARALATDPDILVLDEATSSVDSETEALIEDATATLMAGRTCLVIAHRLSTVVKADRILVLHKGQLREQGRHDELLALRGLYYRLYRLHLSGGD